MTSAWGTAGPGWGCRGKRGEPDIHPGQFWFQDVAAGGRGVLERDSSGTWGGGAVELAAVGK